MKYWIGIFFIAVTCTGVMSKEEKDFAQLQPVYKPVTDSLDIYRIKNRKLQNDFDRISQSVEIKVSNLSE